MQVLVGAYSKVKKEHEGGVFAKHSILVKLSQCLKTEAPTLVTELPIVTPVRLLQLENAFWPMLVTLLPMVTEVIPLQLLNARSSMIVTELGMVTLVKLLQLSNILNLDNQ